MKDFDHIAVRGAIKDGKLTLKSPRYLKGMMQQYKDCNVVITVEKQKKARSLSQLRYLFGVVYPEISRHTGHSVDELHKVFKTKYLSDKIIWRGANMLVVNSTKSLSTTEMAEFVTNVVVEAADLGITVPEPDQSLSWQTHD